MDHSPTPNKNHSPRLSDSNSTIDMLLGNLAVISQLDVGDKLDFMSTGQFTIHKHSWYSSAYRRLWGISRWEGYNKIRDLIYTTELLMQYEPSHRKQVTKAMKKCIHGIQNLRATYNSDVTLRANLDVMINKLKFFYEEDQNETDSLLGGLD